VTNTVACGDSGNDILMLGGSSRAVVVGNAQPALARWAEETRAREASSGNPRAYERGGRLFIATEKEAFGIIQGLKRFGFLAAGDEDEARS